MEGRSLSQHLSRNFGCKQVVNSSCSFAIGGSLPAVAPEPIIPMQLLDSDDSTDAAPNDFDEEGSIPLIETQADIPVLHNAQSLEESNLLEVVTFPVVFTDSARHEVELLKLLIDIGAPNYSFHSFMQWGRNCRMDNYQFQPNPQRYESQIRNLTELVGMTGCRPKAVPVTLEPDNLTLDVIVFPFATMLSSLLNCPKLNKIENLVVNPLNRFGRYRSTDGSAGEVNSAQWYQDTYDQVIQDPDKDFLAPIIFTMDKTVISEASHLSVYVILFTTSIYNREVTICLFFYYYCLLVFILLLTFPLILLDTQHCPSLETFSLYS